TDPRCGCRQPRRLVQNHRRAGGPRQRRVDDLELPARAPRHLRSHRSDGTRHPGRSPPRKRTQRARTFARGHRMTQIRRLFRTPWLVPLLALCVLYALFTALAPDTFARQSNLLTMLRQTAGFGIAAVGMTFTIVLGGTDLSVGSAVALTTAVVAESLRAGMGAVAATALGVLTGGALG